MSWFYRAIPVGAALGYALGGGIVKLYGDAQWRWAFYSVVPLGVALGVWCFFMPDPPRGQTEQAVSAAPRRKFTPKVYFYLLTFPSFTLNTLGMTMITFAIGRLALLIPAYLIERGAFHV